MKTPIRTLFGILGLAASALATGAHAAPQHTDAERLARGRYLIVAAGCNDCHTPGYAPSGGQVPDQQWLTGDVVGFQGPWGTSYPSNLRLSLSRLDEQQWLSRARSPMLPPMPAPSLKAMTDDDLLAIYAFIRSLGASGEPAPTAAAPGVQVTTPYIEFTPKNLPQQQAALTH
ncbi:cytochrome c [Sinimarinibacterium sp. CAU 1509]|uniref:c-type cytochrome n=1 Tax=Sinimarinibacterium sp. CAU 1509 TaxID=2562283 RepID=UPI0010AC4436|nr:cytochrome c [Sinimarinibacterium sp. CAU 1509]TJY59744.1 cytochrome c [Sinimarinibacterium sp. CAU 1509]